jgi:endonuclease/exonuclease/phosphatase (EEP) superfamily protein YafD
MKMLSARQIRYAIAALKFLINLAALGATFATILGFFGNHAWFLEIFNHPRTYGNPAWFLELLDHPRPQYCLILAIALMIGGIFRQKWCFFWCLPLSVNLILIVPLFLPPSSPFNPLNNFPQILLTIIHSNLDVHNQQYAATIQYLESQNADIILLQEVTPAWLNYLQSHLKKYRIETALPRENTHGVAMLIPNQLSKSLTILQSQIIHLPSGSPRPMIELIIREQNREVAILSISTTRSTHPGTSEFQQAEFKAVADWSLSQQQAQKRSVIIIGDFNSTPWSNRFRQFLRDGNLNNSQRGFGLQPTWPTGFPFPLMIPIDHCLHSESIQTFYRTPGPDIGSDHLPLLVKFQL